MPRFVVKQPNGRFAEFSTVVDDFTMMNATESDMRLTLVGVWGTDCGNAKVDRAIREEACACTDPSLHAHDNVPKPGQPLHRWKSCIQQMEALGKTHEVDRAEVAQW